ncbi:MAG TPA: PEP-utilizing enzyme [Solirubrobacteraceae bacterium]|nr:PEP-utilizing enzyme [Solirubrobacteraceae bacterium]
MSEVGRGTAVASWPATTGTVRVFREPQDVIAALDTDLEETIAFVDSGGTTFLGPILGRLGGILCRSGTLRSHLAIVSREYELPCIVGVELNGALDTGDRVTMAADGAVTRT